MRKEPFDYFVGIDTFARLFIVSRFPPIQIILGLAELNYIMQRRRRMFFAAQRIDYKAIFAFVSNIFSHAINGRKMKYLSSYYNMLHTEIKDFKNSWNRNFII